MNYSQTAYEVIDLIKSKGIDATQTKKIIFECSQIIDNPTIRYIDEKLYNLKDICYVFNQNIREIISYMNNNNLIYVQDSEENFYICDTVLDELLLLINKCIAFRDLNYEIERIISDKNKINIKNKTISIRKINAASNLKRNLEQRQIECERVSAEIPRISMEW